MLVINFIGEVIVFKICDWLEIVYKFLYFCMKEVGFFGNFSSLRFFELYLRL